jgi:flagellar biosynthesis/type III secretory pathway M-ring protein FliF/YscJ
MKAFLKEFLQLLRQEKKWWLIPLAVLLLLAVAALFLFSSNSGVSWALYPSK